MHGQTYRGRDETWNGYDVKFKRQTQHAVKKKKTKRFLSPFSAGRPPPHLRDILRLYKHVQMHSFFFFFFTFLYPNDNLLKTLIRIMVIFIMLFFFFKFERAPLLRPQPGDSGDLHPAAARILASRLAGWSSARRAWEERPRSPAPASVTSAPEPGIPAPRGEARRGEAGWRRRRRRARVSGGLSGRGAQP